MWALWIVFGLLQDPTIGTAGKDPVDVCNVLANLDRYKNQTVRIKGSWLLGPHFTTVGGDCQPLRTGTFLWRSEIHVAQDSIERRNQYRHVPIDLPGIRRAYSLREQQQRNGRTRQVTAVFHGFLMARDRLEVAKGDDGQSVGGGFCGDGACPAQLILTGITEVTVAQK